MVPLIYLDNNASTRIDPRVLDAMMPFLTENYANASSNHLFGITAFEAVKKARIQVASLIDCNDQELFFTSSATEAISLAINGIAESTKHKGNHIVTVQTEHAAVLDSCKFLEGLGFDVTYLQVKENGLLDLELLKQSVRTNTILVCVMFVNNETGVVQPIEEIAEITHSKGALFMTDGTQAVGKIPVKVNECNIDLMSFSGHKFYGPKGVGALYIREKNKINLNITLHRDVLEIGLRSGTLNVPGIVGIGKAAEIATMEMKPDSARIYSLRDYLESELLKLEGTFLNGSTEHRIFNVSNICFKGVDADIIISALKNIAVSNGSACTSKVTEPSHVLKAMKLADEDAFSSIRFSLGKFNTKEELNITIEELKFLIGNLRLTAKD